MKIDETSQVIHFAEKPKGPNLKSMRVDSSILGLSSQEVLNFPYIASMAVYVFRTNVLLRFLKRTYPSCNDFGSEIINVRDYWEDIGTIKSFFNANLVLTQQPPRFDFNNPKTSFYTSQRFLPHTKVEKCKIVDAIISHGSFLRECSIERSIVGVRSCLDYGVEFKSVKEADRMDEGFFIGSGITVILKNFTVNDGTII